MRKILIIWWVLCPVLGWSQLYWGDGLYPIDSCNFDEPCDMISISTDEGNLWQIGKPQKILFDSAYSPEWAIVTDTIANYPVGNHSWFQIGVPVQYMDPILLSFTHRIDSDDNRDGGYVEISTDTGATWTNLILDSIDGGGWPYITSDNFYDVLDTLYNGEPGFSGTSADWITSQFQWIWWFPVKPGGENVVLSEPTDSVLFRFHFISDSTDSEKEGWMIDNITVSRISLSPGVYGISPDDIGLSLNPNPARNKVTVRFDNPRQFRHTISITTMAGNLVQKFEDVRSDRLWIERNNLPAGVYLLTIISEKGASAHAKLIFE